MVITCDDLWREISNYLDDEVGTELQLAIDGHLRECKRCAAVFAGTRNVIELYGDERMQQVPSGFSSRLHQTLESRLLANRRNFLGWIVATAATALVVGGFETARSSVLGGPALRSKHANDSNRVPPDVQVIVAEQGKTFSRCWMPIHSWPSWAKNDSCSGSLARRLHPLRPLHEEVPGRHRITWPTVAILPSADCTYLTHPCDVVIAQLSVRQEVPPDLTYQALLKAVIRGKAGDFD